MSGEQDAHRHEVGGHDDGGGPGPDGQERAKGLRTGRRAVVDALVVAPRNGQHALLHVLQVGRASGREVTVRARPDVRDVRMAEVREVVHDGADAGAVVDVDERPPESGRAPG